MSDSDSSYNEDDGYSDEYEYEDESEEIVLEEELPHEEDEYTESDSYEYPYPTSSDDSWAELSSDEAIQKIIEKLPTYSSESSGDEPIPQSPPLNPASDSDAGSFIEHNDEKDKDYNYNYDPDLYLKSVETYELYVISHTDTDDENDEYDADEDGENDGKDENIETPKTPKTPKAPQTPKTPQTPNDKIIQGQAQQDQPEPEPEIERNENENNIRNENNLIKPSQSEIAIISEDACIDDYKQNDVIISPGSPMDKYRGRDKPRRMTKTRIVIKKVKAKRAPKKFKMDMKISIKNNKEYDGVIGSIRYIGIINDNKMVGIEILNDGIMGNTDGIYNENGQRYFECKSGSESQKGLFLPIKQVKKYINKDMRKKSNEFMKRARERRRYQRNNAQMYGNVVDILWKERIDLVKQKKYKIVHKAGPRDAGRIEYFGGDEQFPSVLNDPTHWLEPRLRLPKRGKNEKPPAKKAGPRDIGRKDSFVGISYTIGEEEEIRARKKAILEAKKKKEWEEARRKKLAEGKITRAEYPHVSKQKSQKKIQKKKKDIKKDKKKNIKKDKKDNKKKDDKKDNKKDNKKNNKNETNKNINKKLNKKKSNGLKPSKRSKKKSKSTIPLSKKDRKNGKKKTDSLKIKKGKAKNGAKPRKSGSKTPQ